MKNIILFSGGIDSTTLLYDLISKHKKTDITSVFFNYGQKSYSKEKTAVEQITTVLDISFTEINITDIFKHSNSSLIKHNATNVTEKITIGNKIDFISKNTEIEFRNGVMLTATISLALQLYPDESVAIYYGAAKTREPYPDCSLTFTEYINLMASYISDGKVAVNAPFLNMGKDEIVVKAIKPGVPLKDTWSCYLGEDIPCGKCPACLDRLILGVESC